MLCTCAHQGAWGLIPVFSQKLVESQQMQLVPFLAYLITGGVSLPIALTRLPHLYPLCFHSNHGTMRSLSPAVPCRVPRVWHGHRGLALKPEEAVDIDLRLGKGQVELRAVLQT